MTFISLLIVCSASWIITNITDGLFGWTDWDRTEQSFIANINTYINTVEEDTLSAYFTVGDTLDTSENETYYTYDGKLKEPTLTIDGAKAFYGDRQGTMTDAEFLTAINDPDTRPYTVKWEAGEFYNSEVQSNIYKDAYKEYRGVIAGTHYYRIIDNATGSVICYKHAVIIRQDELVDAQKKADRAYPVGDTLKSPTVAWTANNADNYAQKPMYNSIDLDSIPIIESDYSGTARTYAKTIRAGTSKLAILNAADTPEAKKIKAVFLNNYSNATNESVTATLNYEILAVCKDGNGNFYPTLCVALDKVTSGTIYAEATIKYGSKTYTASPTHAAAEIPFEHQICCARELKKGVTVLVQNGSNTSTSVSDDFSLLGGSSFKYNVAPEDENPSKTYTTAYYDKSGTNGTSKFLKNKVVLSSKLTINGTLFIAANINAGGGGRHAGQVCGDYAQLDVVDGGSIQVNSGGTVNCLGFIKEAKINDPSDQASDIVFEKGSNLLMPFILYEFRGGTVSSGMQNSANDTFYATPFHRFGFASIDASFKMIGGAKLESMAALTALSMQANAKAAVISSDNKTPLITLPEGASLEVTYKSEETIDNICGKIYLRFDGGGSQTIKLNMLNISKSILTQNISVSTNGSYLPISYVFDIELHNGNYNFEAQKIKLFPGGRIFVGEDASVTASNIILYDKFPAIGTQGSSAGSTPFPNKTLSAGKLEIAGELSAAALGGKVDIVKGALGASLDIASASVNDSYELANDGVVTNYKFGNYYYDKISANAKGSLIYRGVLSERELFAEKYAVFDMDDAESNEKLGWHYQNDISVWYYDENGNKAKLCTENGVWSSEGFTFTDENLPNPPPGTHYTFGGWYTDAACQQAFTEQLVYEDIQLYAKWIPKVYTATIYNVYPGQTPVVKETISFTIEDEVATSQSIAGTAQYNFGGWYKNADCSEAQRHKSETISASDLLDNGSVLYIKWIAEKTYTITFKSDHHANVFAGSATVTESQMTDGVALNTVKPYDSDYKDNVREQYYFSHWLYNGQPITSLTEAMKSDSNITITAVWIKKSSITFKSATSLEAYAGGLVPYYNEPIYYPLGTVTLPNLKANDAASTTNLYYFISWDLAGASPGGSYDLFTINGEMQEAKDITITVKWGYKYLVTISKTNGESVSGLVSGTYYPGPSVTGISVSAASGYKNATIAVVGNSGATYSGGTLTFPAQSNTHIEVKLQTSSESCIASGTLITLADGTQKRVEDLLETDVLLVFDHETGRFVEAPIVFIERDGWSEYNVINLKFSDGRVTRLIYEHGLFDLTLNKYVYITEENCTEFIGHEFAVIDGDAWSTVTLTEAFVTTEYVGCYSLVTAYHLNYFIDGLFSMPGGIEGLFNIFEYGDGMVYDEEQMQKDIETYGLYTYEDFAEYIPEEVYNAFPAAHLKVAVGKGYLTFDDILGMIERYVVGNGLM